MIRPAEGIARLAANMALSCVTSRDAQSEWSGIMATERLGLSAIHKSFGGAPALRGARLDVRAGEIHGLIGENGAGKSTLINIATGLFRPDSGEIRLDDRPVSLSGPTDAARLGISVVHQEADLFSELSIAENMLMGKGLVRRPGGLIDWPGTYREAGSLVETMGESFDVRRSAGGLSVARRMMAEIAAAVGSGSARVLFLDEPTASLTQNEAAHLFDRIRKLRDAGVAIVYVSHRLDEVLDLCDRITVMRDGETIETRPASECTVDSLVAAMVGREVVLRTREQSAPGGEVRLRVTGASHPHGLFTDVSLEVRAGEVLGLYGFVGAGRSELAQALFGLEPMSTGEVEVDGRSARARSPREAVDAGLAYLPEDRLVQGVFRTHSLRANAGVAALRRLCTMGLVRPPDERKCAETVISEMRVRTTGIEQPIGALSGGNQQKVVFGRWQATHPRVLILDEPTRGVDVVAKAEIHRLIRDMAAGGAAVLLISSDLPEVMALSDRIATMSEGRTTGVFDPAAQDERAVAAAAVPRAAADREPAPGPPGGLSRLSRARELGLVGFIAALAIAMAILRPGQFANAQNLIDILANAAMPAIVAQGAILIICAGGIDISVGSMLGLTAAAAGLAARAGAPPPVCLVMAMAMGCGLSLLNGGISLLARIHPIIVTLAGISIYRGLIVTTTGGKDIQELPHAYRMLADGNLLGVPKVCLYVLAVTLVIHIVLRHTLIGRQVLALGNSATAARLIGLSKARLTLFVFAVSGALVGLTSVLNGAYYGNVQANTGDGMELKAIAAAVIGGTSIEGGRGSAVGGLLGAFLVAMVYNALVLLKVSSFWQNLFVGALILLAVVAGSLGRRRGGATA